ncbi:MAG: (Fe-S)-binding protein [Acidobacteriota bacterium]
MSFAEVVIVWVIFISAIALFSGTLEKRISALMQGAKADPFDKPFKRIKGVLEFAFIQKRLLRDSYAGIYHLFIFWGFVFLAFRGWQTVFDSLFPKLNLLERFGQMGLYYLTIKDVFVVLVLLGIALALIRRIFLKPQRLENSIDAFITLGFIATLMVSDIVSDSSSIILNNPFWSSYTPFSQAASSLFQGFDKSSLLIWNRGALFVHIIAFLGFLNFLPYSKHFHIFTSLFNVYFRNLDEEKNIRKIDLESEHFGISQVKDFTWKEMLDFYTCTECGRCIEGCPTNLTKKPLKPKEYGNQLRDLIYSMSTEEISGEKEIPEEKQIIGKTISEETIWACTTCRYCEWACPLFINFVPKLVGHRSYLTLEESNFPNEAQIAFKGMERQGNPWNLARSDRMKWAEGLDVKHISEVEGKKYLLWVGCAGAYEDSQKKVTRALVKILNCANVNFGVLGEEENCTGDAARRLGNEYLFATLAEQNVETIKGYNVSEIITACPHCLQSLKVDYKDFGGDFKVTHAITFIADLIKQNRITLKGKFESRTTFHDPCYLSRYEGDTESARYILNKISPNFKELEWSGEKSICCGAGGGRFWLEEKIGDRINHFRFNQIAESGASCAVVGCPFCHTMLDNARGELGKEEIVVKDLIEIIADMVEEN